MWHLKLFCSYAISVALGVELFDLLKLGGLQVLIHPVSLFGLNNDWPDLGHIPTLGGSRQVLANWSYYRRNSLQRNLVSAGRVEKGRHY